MILAVDSSSHLGLRNCSPLIHSIISNDSGSGLIILSGLLLSTDTFYCIQWFWQWTHHLIWAFVLHWYILLYPMILAVDSSSHLGLCSPLIHSVASNDSGSGLIISSGSLLPTDTFCCIQWFWQWTHHLIWVFAPHWYILNLIQVKYKTFV